MCGSGFGLEHILLTPWTAIMSGVLFSSSVLVQLTSAPCARASAMSGKLREKEAQYSCRPGVNCFGSQKTIRSLPEHSSGGSVMCVSVVSEWKVMSELDQWTISHENKHNICIKNFQLKLNNDKAVVLKLLYNWNCILFIIEELCNINTVIFLFITVKVFCYVHKCEMTCLDLNMGHEYCK